MLYLYFLGEEKVKLEIEEHEFAQYSWVTARGFLDLYAREEMLVGPPQVVGLSIMEKFSGYDEFKAEAMRRDMAHFTYRCVPFPTFEFVGKNYE